MRFFQAIPFVALSTGTAQAQILDGSLSGLAFGDGIEIARATLGPDCRSINAFDLSAPRLPLAAERESALICWSYASPGGLNLDTLVLRFADGRSLVPLGGADRRLHRARGRVANLLARGVMARRIVLSPVAS